MDFAYLFHTPDFRHVVVQPRGEEKIILRSTMDISESHLKLLKKLARRERVTFLWDLKFGLLWKDTDFQMVPDAPHVRQFVFTRILHADGLNKAVFEAAVAELHRAMLFVSWSLLRLEELQQPRLEAR